jgi:hypothetical protein
MISMMRSRAVVQVGNQSRERALMTLIIDGWLLSPSTRRPPVTSSIFVGAF